MRSKSSKRTRPNGVKISVVRGARMSGWYNRLDLGNGRGLTWSASMKCLGDIPRHVVDAWWALPASLKTDSFSTERSAEIQTAMDAFADNLDVLWPEWSVAPKVPDTKPGDRFEMSMGPRRGIKQFTVMVLPSGRKKTYTVQFDDEPHLTRIPASMLAKAVKA